MLKQFMKLWKQEAPCQSAWEACLAMLRESQGMYHDAVASMHREGALQVDIYARDRAVNKYERKVRRDIVTHLAVSTNPDINTALVLTAIVIDIERIGDYTKNIVELASAYPGVFTGGEVRSEIADTEKAVARMFDALLPCLENSDDELARKILGDHLVVTERVEDVLHDLLAGKVLADDAGCAVMAALYLRYLKRVSAHIKNAASSVVNPYYRIGFREKSTGGEAADRAPGEDTRN
jgi:phosphate uptake regulator